MCIPLVLLTSTVLTLEPREYTAEEVTALIGGRSDLIVRSVSRDNPTIITGGRRISGWSVGADGVWRVPLPEVKRGRWYFSQLFVNGARRYRPRVPETGWFESIEPTRVVKDKNSPDFGVGGFTYGGDLVRASWLNRSDLEIQMLFEWNGARMKVRDIDEKRHEIVLSVPHPRVSSHHSPKNRRFAVENVKEAFSGPGQWYLDRRSGILSYRPMAGETPESVCVEAPFSESILMLEGVRNVEFKDIVFRLDNKNVPFDRSEFTLQGEIGSGAAIDIRRSSNVAFNGCVFVNLGAWAVSFDDQTSNCRISSCVIADVGAGGVKIGSPERAGENIVVEDTEIYETGRRNPGGPGIMAVKAKGCAFRRNHIHHAYYTGISVGWGWCREKEPSSQNNEIAYNHIHDIGLRQLSDMGLIYLLCQQPGTRVHHNYLHDVRSWEYGATGIYPDECSAQIEIDHNFVQGTGRSFHCNMIRELDVHDNVFVDGDLLQWDFSNYIGEEENILHLYRNTFVWSGGCLAMRRMPFHITEKQRQSYKVPFWSGLNLHDNMYWRRDGQERVFPSAGTDVEDVTRLTLAEFKKASGQERGSIFGNPGRLSPLKVCGKTGVASAARHATWKMPDMPRPLGREEQYVVRRANAECRMNRGIETTIAKLNAGKEVTVCYFGGSVTQGSAYRPVFTEWLRKRFPTAVIREVNAGIGGTGSNLGVYRLEHDVLCHNPDLVFVEFALNDSDGTSVEPSRIGANVEAIVKGIWRKSAETDIVFLYTISRALAKKFRTGVLTREAAIYDTVADRYAIPTINFAPCVLERERAGKLIWTLGERPTAVPKEGSTPDRSVLPEGTAADVIVFSKDGVHPLPEGGALYVEALKRFFMRRMPRARIRDRTNLVSAGSFADEAIIAPMSIEVYSDLLKGEWRCVKETDAEYGSFLKRTDSLWISDTPGSRLEFDFTGAECSLYALYGPSGARLSVSIDGHDMGNRDLFDRYSSYWRLMLVPIFKGERGRHHVVILISKEQPNRNAAQEFQRLSRDEIEKIGFDGHRVAIGRIFLDGHLAGR